MKQNVSAPVALIVIALCAMLAIAIFARPKAERITPEDIFVLPYAPNVDESSLKTLRQAVAPLGVAVIFPPLTGDRFAGARLALVAPGSPAGAAGLQPGDLVRTFNGLEIGNPFALAAAVAMADPEKPSEVVIERAGEEQEIVITGMKPLAPVGRPFSGMREGGR